MGRLAIILTILACAALSVGAAVYFIVIQPGLRLDAESRQYADAAIKAIVADWNPKELRDRASPEFMHVSDAKQIDELFDIYRQLGHVKVYSDLKGEAMTFYDLKAGPSITASYVVNADFEQDKAQVAVRLIKRPRGWQILAFRINSPIFMKRPDKKDAPPLSPATP